MIAIGFLRELLIVLAATLSIAFLFHKMRLPTVVGFLLAGVVVGPHGFALIRGVEEVELLAEIGVVLLLFAIGVEFSLAHLLPVRRRMIWGGLLQVGLTTLAVIGLSTLQGEEVELGILYGFLVALSSTAIVLKVYNDSRELDSLHGRLATGTLLFQDLCIVPMMLIVPVLAHSGSISLVSVGWAIGKALLALLIIFLAARAILPWFLRQIAALRNRELFVLFIVFVCLGTAWLTSASGLSLALGAFIAGLIISESEFSHQIVAEILPLRDCFSGIFFISIGMLLNLGFLAGDWWIPLAYFGVIVGLKSAVVVLVFWWLYGSPRLGVVLGLSLAQVGEFSFILANTARLEGLLQADEAQIFLAAAILSMIATPFLIDRAHGLALGLDGMMRRGARGLEPAGRSSTAAPAAGHVIVVGYGLNGQNLARVLKEVGIPYAILEMDPDLVQEARAAGEPIHFGDGTRSDVLDKVGIAAARVLVVAISDPLATGHVVAQARRLRPDLKIVVRTRYVVEIDRLYRLGANQVIPEEFETSVEIFARVLDEYHIPRNVIALQVDMIRREHYGMLRGMRLEGKRLDELSEFLLGTTTDTFLVTDRSPAVGKSLGDLGLLARDRLAVIAAVRDGESVHSPGADFALRASDVLVALGSHEELDRVARLVNPTGGDEN
jgi:CPA2 family monovalent cation:H+ antiporter-2